LPTTFGIEILRRKVVDIAGEVLGTLADFSIDTVTGNIVAILVVVESGIDPSVLPWISEDGLLSIPVEEIDTIGTNVQLKK
jgi:sporulation protein YlmC with PRC-barrel domain|tara:strand:- start:402 stop:644 length:243 start_codon:yes stop_codon:yes gene_type:complete